MRGRPNRGEGEGRKRPLPSASGLPASRAPARLLPPLAELLPEAWKEESFLAIDFETTGLDPAKERVVEIGALRFVPKEGMDFQGSASFASLVAPGISIPAEVVAIHGIRDEDVAFSPSFAELAPSLLALAEGAIIIAHNAPFDLAFLRHELKRAGLALPANRVLDTRLLAKAAFPRLTSYRLGDLARGLGLDCGRSHRALDDARTCAALFLAAAPLIEAQRSPRGTELQHPEAESQAPEAAR